MLIKAKKEGLEVLSRSPEITEGIGSFFAKRLIAGDILAFSGDLGSGKTCFIRGVCRGLKVPANIYITSPTFVILNRYEGRLPIYHFDFYRLISEEEIMDLGYEEYFFGQGVCLIEWAERVGGLMPEAHLKVNMYALSENERRIEFQFSDEQYRRRFSQIDLDLILPKIRDQI